MAATVVSVVIFLCGVLVGRGVKTERAVSSADAAAVAAVAEPATSPAAVAAPPAAGTDPTTAAPPPAVGDLTYFNRLEKKTQPLEDLRPALAPPAAAERDRPSLMTAPLAARVDSRSPGAGAAPGDGSIASRGSIRSLAVDDRRRRLRRSGSRRARTRCRHDREAAVVERLRRVRRRTAERPRRRCTASASASSRRGAKRKPPRRGSKKKSSSSPGSPAEAVDRRAGGSACSCSAVADAVRADVCRDQARHRSSQRTRSGTRT